MMHLDPDKYAALLGGSLPPNEARDLSAHLAQECDICERFLADRGGADALDGAADAAIVSALPPAGGAGDNLEFARIKRRVPAVGTARRRNRLVAALAASILFAGVAGLVAQLRAQAPTAAPWDGVKGTDVSPIPVRLRFLKLTPGGAVEKGISGEPAGRVDSLLFEVEVGRAAEVAIARVGPGGAVELFWRSRLGAGRTQLTVSGKTAAYPLAALSGPQRFVLLASEQGLDDARALRAAADLAPPRGIQPALPSLDGLSIDVAEVLVR